jgi:hypothetical protein
MSDNIHIDEFERMLTAVNVDEMYIKQLFDIYHQRLISNAKVCKKLNRRGIGRNVIGTHYIGYCDRTLNRYVEKVDKPDGAGIRGALRRAELTKANGHELFRGCIVEPVFMDDMIIAACGIKLISPSRTAPRIIQWYKDSVYTQPISFQIMSWGMRYVNQ